jgi:hypothetical protein
MQWWCKSCLVATSEVGGVLLKLESSTASKDSSSVSLSADTLRLTFDANITLQMRREITGRLRQHKLRSPIIPR